MWGNIARGFLSQGDDVIIRVDPTWGFSEFPSPGDTKKHLLPVLVDYELAAAPKVEPVKKEETVSTPQNKFWMPDRFCKVCYGCEEAFTMYRRRHHCRMCGQIFCNSCSSFYIDGKMFNSPGLVRACRLCYEQQNDTEHKAAPRLKTVADTTGTAEDQPHLVPPRQVIAAVPVASWVPGGHSKVQDTPESAALRSSTLQERASAHLSAIVDRLLAAAGQKIELQAAWKDLIVNLVREVVSSVDPDVRHGRDNMDIRPYVKIKVIPGGSIDESVYIDGVVFRKNVSHKKMGANASRTNPRILLISEGIEFQRADMKLSSMDTLIEQEEKHMELAVEKIMSLKPDIILVGKAIGRKAQELLCGHNVVVMQNVKAHLLERIARMTGAMLLPSTDHMIKQFGEECLGTCTHFRLRVVHDDPEKKAVSQPRRILETRIARGSTYAYIQGCPSDRGCSIILRGAGRATLKEIKRILTFSVIVAYHLRLEVAYYMDRYACLPDASALPAVEECPDGSDVDDVVVDVPNGADHDAEDGEESHGVPRILRSRRERQLLSTSLDVDINLPFSKELVGTELFMHAKAMRNKTSVDSHQTLLVTSLLVGEGSGSVPAQKSSPDVKGIKYYTKQDIALGQFIIENCFQLNRSVNRESTMLDQTLSFIHRPGRLDITVRRSDFATSTVAGSTDEHGNVSGRDPRSLPIYMSSYCKLCKKMVTPAKLMSEETWKMSFGKFLEMSYYNKSARCNIGDCTHNLRDDHILYVQCESYVADFTFIPIHPYALNVRNTMKFPEDVHVRNSMDILTTLPMKHQMLIEDFRLAMGVLEREIKELMANRPEELELAMADVKAMEIELLICSSHFLEEIIRTFDHAPAAYRNYEPEFLTMLNDKLATMKAAVKASEAPNATVESTKLERSGPSLMGFADSTFLTGTAGEDRYAGISTADRQAPASPGSISPDVGLNFPFTHLRETFCYAVRWNNRMNNIYTFLESVTKAVAQQQLANPQPAVAVPLVEAEHADEEGEFRRQQSESGPALSAATPPPPPGVTASPTKEGPRDSHVEPVAMLVPALERMATSSLQPPSAPSVKAKAPEKEKPMDKMSRFTKAIQRFLVLGNKEAVVEQHTKFFVPLEEFGHGRFGMKPGRRGEVIPVYEDEYATIIAYSLASEEYYEGLQEALMEGGDGVRAQRDVAGGSAEQAHEVLDDEMDGDQAVEDAPAAEAAPAAAAAAATTERAGIARSLLSGLNKRATMKPNAVKEDAAKDAEARNKEDEAASAASASRSVLTMERAFANAQAEDAASSDVSAFATGNTLFQSSHETGGGDSLKRGLEPSGMDEATSARTKMEQANSRSQNEKQLISQDKSYIRHRFDDLDEKGNVNCKFQCQTYWAKQFEALRTCYFKGDDRQGYIRSLATSRAWAALGGKSGASFSKSSDERLVIKCISRVELQMFLEFAPAYFEYMAKAYYHNLPTVLCKILGVYTIRYDNKDTGRRAIENVVVMENIFYQRNITRTFDLKGSSRARYVDLGYKVENFDEAILRRRLARRNGEPVPAQERISQVLLDDNLMELTNGRPFPLKHRAKLFFHKAVQNDTLFLSIINVVDYSILVGFDENTHEIVVGIIDYMRQYDFIKRMERMGKSVGMIAGQAEPTIIQPPQYRKRFSLAMERYFMTIPDKWITHES